MAALLRTAFRLFTIKPATSARINFLKFSTPSASKPVEMDQIKKSNEYFDQYIEEYTEQEEDEPQPSLPKRPTHHKKRAAAELVHKMLEQNRARDIVCAQLETTPYNFVFVCTSQNRRHSRALAELLKHDFVMPHAVAVTVQQKRAAGWYFTDLGEVAVHVMDEELREKFDLESLWAIDDVEVEDEDLLPPPRVE